MVFFGLQYFVKSYLLGEFNKTFFKQPKAKVMNAYSRRIRGYLGADLTNYKHVEDLHDLGYLPIKIKAVEEGTRVPMRVPCLTIVNTKPEFFWVTNLLETLMSSVLWQACTSATIGDQYSKLLNKHAEDTGMPKEFVQWQGHDFSFRGMSSPESAILSGMGHLLSFTGTDTIPAIDALEQYYGANCEKELIGGSVAATEHSVMTCGNQEGELEIFDRLITQIYPAGILSVVSDSFNLWDVLTKYMVVLKDKIMAREGKIVIRPDSGDPVDIICGDPKGKTEPERKGVIELLWDVFGGTKNEKGYRVLDSHVGAIYGDSINLLRAEQICTRLKDKGFASQCVFGIGSYTYQYNTRDTLGLAVKATYCEVDGAGREIFKKPITDDGMKNSAKGLLRVDKGADGRLVLKDQVTREEEQGGELTTVFENGKLVKETTLADIRKRLL